MPAPLSPRLSYVDDDGVHAGGRRPPVHRAHGEGEVAGTTVLRYIALGLCLALGSTPVQAQLVVEPSGLAVTVPQAETATRTVTLTNAGSEPLSFCFSFERPLQRTSGTARLSAEALGAACGPYGEVLALVDESAIEAPSWNPYGLAMTPDGRLFAAERFNATNQTYELTPSLEVARVFEHPVVEELTVRATTTGVAYNVDTGTPWWLNIEGGGFATERALLLEGDLDGVPTGRRIELPVADSAPPPAETGRPVGLAYDPAQGHFFFTDVSNDDIWAVDTLGAVVDGYPVRMEAYPGATIARGIDALPAAEPEGLRLELYVNPPGPTPPRHLGVVGRHGEDTAPGAGPLETPLVEPLPGTAEGNIGGEALRSALDPNGVLYYPWSEFQNAGVVAVRPHPLPPSWLVVEAWDGALAPGESRTIALRFQPGTRAAGTYTAVLQAFTAATGEAVEVPLSLTVTQGTDAEGGSTEPEASRLSVHPNPLTSSATISYGLAAPSAVRLVVYDVLGRAVAVLEDDMREAGSYEVRFDAAGLPAGTYFYRLTAGDHVETKRMTVVR